MSCRGTELGSYDQLKQILNYNIVVGSITNFTNFIVLLP